MAGNSQRRGAMRNPGSKKGAVKGSGGQKARSLRGKGPTPKAEERVNHPAARLAATRAKNEASRQRRKAAAEATELVAGRNPVAECLRAGVPATALYVALGIDADDRITHPHPMIWAMYQAI